MARWWVLASALFLFYPALARGADTAASGNAANMDVLQKLYPPRALAAREQGSVGFTVKIDKTGHPTECNVTKSSGYPLLDQETCQLITLHAIFDPNPALSGSQQSTHAGVVDWRLPSSGLAPTAAPASTQATLADSQEKLVCKRVPATGSNVGYERVCASKRSWDKARAEVQDSWDQLQGRKGSTSGN